MTSPFLRWQTSKRNGNSAPFLTRAIRRRSGSTWTQVDVPKSTLVGAARWLYELRRRDLEAARFILRTAPTYKNDLTPTQYELALEWLIKNRLVDAWGGVADPLGNPAQLVLIAAIDELQPSWLADADVLVPDTRDLPLDILEIGSL